MSAAQQGHQDHQDFSVCPWIAAIQNNLHSTIHPCQMQQNGALQISLTILIKRQTRSCTHSPHRSPTRPVCKPNGWWCLTINYRELNSNTAPLKAAVPNITSVVTAAQAATASVHGCLRCQSYVFHYSPKGGRQTPVCLYLGRVTIHFQPAHTTVQTLSPYCPQHASSTTQHHENNLGRSHISIYG